MALQVISIAGALAILAAYAANQFGVVDVDNLPYQLANLFGSGILFAIAAIEVQLGFMLLEGSWALVSLWAVVRILRGPTPQSPENG